MDAKTQLRRYLEQRRELGESEFLLDSMSVEEAMQLIGAIRKGSAKASSNANPSMRAADRPSSAPQSPPSAPAAPPRSAMPQAQENVTSAMRGDPSSMAQGVPSERKAAPSDQATPTDVTTEDGEEMKKIRASKVSVGSANETMFSDNPFKDLKSIGAIAKTVEECTRCPLYKTATHAVPGEGNVKAEVMCVGEAPGANEDATGRPFVGAAGQLLTKILAAVDLKREEVFICNVLKHRPPGNRNPLPDEVAACSPYLVRQIEIIRPKVIIAFGTFAAQTLLATKTPIGKLRGSVHEYHGVPLVVTYHPAALLRNPSWKRPTWEDVKLARRVLDNAK